METPSYPAPPWQLCGSAHLNVQLLPTRLVRDIPSVLTVMNVLPGRTLSGIYLARYTADSTLSYSELIVFSAVVRGCGRIGAWVSQIYVDSADSMVGGREIWGLPKQLAEFDWGAEVNVTFEGKVILAIGDNKAGLHIPIYAPLPAFGFRDGKLLHFTGRCRGMAAVSRAAFHIPADSPLSELGLGQGWSFEVAELAARIPAPVEASRIEGPPEG